MARAWFRRDRWDRVLEIEQRLRALEQRSPNFLNRAGAYCFLIATIASVHALRGEMDQAAALRDEAMNIMVAASGPPERCERAVRARLGQPDRPGKLVQRDGLRMSP